MYYIFIICKVFGIIVPLLVAIALFTVAERKVIGAIQRRRGPNTMGFFGLFQAFADGLKLVVKEYILPSSSNNFLFIFAPVLTFFLSLIGWAVIPFCFSGVFVDINLGVLYLLAISSLGVYGIIFAGWSSNSKYAFLGALRSGAQIISYEVSIGFILVSVFICSGSLNLTEVVLSQEFVWYCIPLLPNFILFFVSCLAETNRHPFDLPEAEAELVSGYNVEYSALGFALFFLGEYGNIILISCLTVLLFLGGWLFPIQVFSGSLCFAFKSLFFVCLFIWCRAAFPRYRYDQLIRLGWKVFLPFSMGWVLFTSGLLLGINWLYLELSMIIIDIFYFVFIGCCLFVIGLFGIIINRRNLILILMSVELVLLSVNLNLLFLSVFLDDLLGQVFTLFILTVAAAESALGLAILVSYFRVQGNISMSNINLLQG